MANGDGNGVLAGASRVPESYFVRTVPALPESRNWRMVAFTSGRILGAGLIRYRTSEVEAGT